MPSASQADLDLVRRLVSGDEQAFVGLVRQHHRSMIGVAASFAGPTLAEEVVQETWLAILEGIGRFEGRSSLKTWIFRILANRARTRGQREARTVPFSALGDGEDPLEGRFDGTGHWTDPPRAWAADPEDVLQRSEVLAEIEAAIGRLPPRQRAVLLLRDVEGLDGEEVCNVLDLTETNQRVLLHRARTAVRDAMAKPLDGRA